MILTNYQSFLDTVFQKIQELQINVSKMELDHFGYQAASDKEYEDLKLEATKIGKLVKEDVVNGRKVGFLEFFTPLVYHNRQISAFEFYAPKLGQKVKSGLEHTEFVLQESFSSFLQKYPKIAWDKSAIESTTYPQIKLKLTEDIQVKFLPRPILEVVK